MKASWEMKHECKEECKIRFEGHRVWEVIEGILVAYDNGFEVKSVWYYYASRFIESYFYVV